jgi:hypothetical protein
MPSRLERVICHNGLERVPEHALAAVKNLGQCMQVWSSKSPCWKYIYVGRRCVSIVNTMEIDELAFFEYHECRKESRGG